MEKMLSVQDVAEKLGVSTCFVYRLKDKPNGIRGYRVGRCVRFKPEDVEAYISGQVIQPAEEPERYCKNRFTYVPGMRVV